MKLIKDSNGTIDLRGTMYPSKADKVTDGVHKTEPYSTVYGFVASGSVQLPNGWIANQHQYFCYSSDRAETLQVVGTAVIITRLGFKGQNLVGGPIEDNGRLCYIDGCSDSLLIYPPRMGDPSLNLLYFPPNIDQTFHIHPSIRLGTVASGSGVACFADREVALETGDLFVIEERELHRFRTLDNQEMRVIAFHPDGDWGPTDQNHTMLNRTYITDRAGS